MRNFPLLLLAFLGMIRLGFSQEGSSLQQKLELIARDFKGELGIYVKNLNTQESAQINSDSIFPTASIVKIPILLGIFEKIEKEELQFHQSLIYRDSIKYGGSGLMQFFNDSTQTDLRTLVALMLSYSDNTTSLWLQGLAGGGESINPLLEKWGVQHTRINSRTPGREKDWEIYGWGQTTPKEMAQLLEGIYKGTIFGRSSSEQMTRLLSNSYYTEYALSQIPPTINVLSKQGMVNASRSEVLLVNSPAGDYVLSFFTKNNEDESWEYDNEAWKLSRKVSHEVWNHFNPNSPYQIPQNAEKFLKGINY
ncbi:serine hydrolase [Algoriphagus hitonicola]|uniref:beta-lactamase n=1 Tax=Algoriphagus hitonicola TaxID=435880 RepID=A0A1I2T1C5_9BACT|nr:serine hydrolase [Algoriphagus hitonicola]SFG56967.1 beta-lactamase class A [Algoriphagus hitonicola]